jgi:hypothetical protein
MSDNIILIMEHPKIEPIFIDQIFDKPKNILVFGERASGKTILINKLMTKSKLDYKYFDYQTNLDTINTLIRNVSHTYAVFQNNNKRMNKSIISMDDGVYKCDKCDIRNLLFRGGHYNVTNISAVQSFGQNMLFSPEIHCNTYIIFYFIPSDIINEERFDRYISNTINYNDFINACNYVKNIRRNHYPLVIDRRNSKMYYIPLHCDICNKNYENFDISCQCSNKECNNFLCDNCNYNNMCKYCQPVFREELTKYLLEDIYKYIVLKYI